MPEGFGNYSEQAAQAGQEGGQAWLSAGNAKVFTGIALLAIILAAAWLLFFSGSQETIIPVIVKNEAGVPISGAKVIAIAGQGEPIELETNDKGEAQFRAMQGESIEVSVSKQGYALQKKTLGSIGAAGGPEAYFEFTLKIASPEGPKELAITFEGPDGKKIVGREITAMLKCTANGEFAEPEQRTATGELKVTVPEGCGRVSVTANAEGMKTASETILASQSVIQFAGIERSKGKVQFEVADSSTGGFVDGVTITVKDYLGKTTGVSDTSFGEAQFTLPAGEYTAVLSDKKGRYSQKTATIEVTTGLLPQKINMRMDRDIKLKAKFVAMEKGGGPIHGARVEMSKKSAGESAFSPYGEEKTGQDGNAAFIIGEDGNFAYNASKEGYLGATGNFRTLDYPKGSEKQFDVLLEKCTPEKCGTLRIRVLDENGEAVDNAMVSLLDSQGMLRQYDAKATDFNGYTEKFAGIAEGKYYALAQKWPSQSRSELFEVKATGQNELTMKLVIGAGTASVYATDQTGNPIAFAKADIFTDFGTRVGAIALDAEGKGTSAGIKADKKVYVVIRKDGYAPYFTSSQQVFGGKNIVFKAQLGQGMAGEKATLEFLGAYLDNAQASALQAGKAYTAKFLISVPTGANFSEFGLFARTGSKEVTESDYLWIEEINAPNQPAVSNGLAYRPPKGEAEAGQGNAKWAALAWPSPEGGKYEAEVKIRVREGTQKGTALPLNFRAWSIKDGRVLRDPIDNDLAEAQDSAAKKGLYAESYEKVFYEGIDALCKESFCFSHRLLDETAGLYLNAPYKLKTFSPYTMEFTVMNNSPSMINSGVLGIRNTKDGTKPEREISIESYEITNASNVKSSSAAPVTGINAASGELGQGRTISGNMRIVPRASSPSSMEFSIASERAVTFHAAVPFSVFFEDDVNLTVGPETIAAFIPAELGVKAEYSNAEKKGFPIEGAIIVATRIAPDRSETTMEAVTNSNGEARISTPASLPGTKIIVKVEKPNIATKTVVKEISQAVISFEPKELRHSLNRQTKEEAKSAVSFNNKIDRPLLVKKLWLSIASENLLDEAKMNNYLQQFIGAEIPKNGTKGFEVLTSIGEEAQYLDEPKKIRGTIVAELSTKEDNSARWVSKLPYEATINLAEMPTNSPCIILSARDWKETSLNLASYLDFEITNNCMGGDGSGIQLRNMQAKADWSGTDGVVGTVELSITDPLSGSQSSEILQNGDWSRLSEKMVPGVVYSARLKFVPKEGSLGKTAGFRVSIDAELETNAGKSIVGANNGIDAEILITNFGQCIEITPHPEEGLKLGGNDNEGEISVDTSECGPISVDIRFCGGGHDNCNGGSREGGIEVSPWSFSKIKNESRTAKVERQSIAGLYGISVEARESGAGSWRKIAEIDALVEPEKGDYFTLDKYSFAVVGKGSEDETSLTNSMLQETVQVKANKCEWKEAAPGLSDAEKAGIGLAGAGAGVGVAFAAIAIGASTGIGAVIGIVVFVVIMMMTLFGDDPCEQFVTNPLQDYVINLAGTADKEAARYVPPDAMDIIVSDSRFRGKWNVDITDAVQKADKSWPNGKQVVGAVFENLGAEQDQPIYAIATFRAKEHIHGDATHQNASVQCGTSGSESGDFGMFWINPGHCGYGGRAYDSTYAQKLHVKFKTKEEVASLPKVSFDTFDCQSGIEIGRTGKGALPRTKLDWSWKNISDNACDSGNENYIYCDATQFTIELSKKLHSLNQFLEKNNYDLGCPLMEEEMLTAENAVKANDVANIVAANSLGISSTKAAVGGKQIKVIVKATNNTGSAQSLTVKNTAGNPAGLSETCTVEITGIPANGEKEGLCSIEALDEGTYAVVSEIAETSDSERTSKSGTRAGAYVGDPLGGEGRALCSLKITETYAGVPQIMRFVEGKNNVVWTEKVPNSTALASLLVFDAYLMKDNYSKEFFRDFAAYYTTTNFEDTPSYFTALVTDSGGKKYGFNRMLEKGAFVAKRKYVDSSELPGAGLYRVEIGAYFGDDDWRFFDQNGDTKAGIAIIFTRKGEPYPNSPFYALPLDGFVGLDGDSLKRQNYGTAFTNNRGPVLINNATVPLKTFSSDGSFGIMRAEVKQEQGFYSLNTAPETRGVLLSVQSTGVAKTGVTFQPSSATPIILKATKSGTSQEKFASYHALLEGGAPLKTGTSLTYWSGAGNCLDFTGEQVTQAFYEKPDSTAAEDEKSDLQNYYKIEWPNAQAKGDVYLRTIMYTSPKTSYALQAKQGGVGTFLTPENTGEIVDLKGVSIPPLSMEDIFILVENGSVCATNNGVSTKFFWNPKFIYGKAGSQRSITKFANSLEAGKTCIG